MLRSANDSLPHVAYKYRPLTFRIQCILLHNAIVLSESQCVRGDGVRRVRFENPVTLKIVKVTSIYEEYYKHVA